MAEFVNTHTQNRTWVTLSREDGRTLHLDSGESAEVFRWVWDDDGAPILEPVESLQDPYLRPVPRRKPVTPVPGATTEAAPPAESTKE